MPSRARPAVNFLIPQKELRFVPLVSRLFLRQLLFGTGRIVYHSTEGTSRIVPTGEALEENYYV